MAEAQSHTGAKLIRSFFGSGGKLANDVTEKLSGYNDDAMERRSFGEYVRRKNVDESVLKKRHLESFIASMKKQLQLAEKRYKEDQNYVAAERNRLEGERRDIDEAKKELKDWILKKRAQLSVE